MIKRLILLTKYQKRCDKKVSNEEHKYDSDNIIRNRSSLENLLNRS